VNRNVSVQAGTGIKISNNQAQDAIDAFTSQFQAGGYTGATITAIDSLHASLTGTPGQSEMTPAGKVVGGILLVGLIILILLVVRSWVRAAKNLQRSTNTSSSHSTYTRSSSSSSSYSSYDSGSSSSSGGDSGGGAGGHF